MIFIEAKSTKECNDTVLKYYERIRDKKSRGAIMFAVCRGKISEGIDFANDNGRGVIGKQTRVFLDQYISFTIVTILINFKMVQLLDFHILCTQIQE
jgi:hypothetical protein